MDATAGRSTKSQRDLSDLQEKDRFLLHFASQIGHTEVVEKLIRAGASVDLQEKNSLTPLHCAAQNGHNEVVEKLIRAGASVDLRANDGSGKSPLFSAAQRGHADVVEKLIHAGANVNLQVNVGATAIYIAAQNGHSKIVDKLICAQASVDLQEEDGWSPLHIAVLLGEVEAVDKLIRAQANLDLLIDLGASAISFAAHNGSLEIVRKLLKAQACIDFDFSDQMSPIDIAAQKGHHDIVDALVATQCEVNLRSKNGISTIYIAAQCGREKVIERLIRSQTWPDFYSDIGVSPFIVLVLNGNFEVIQHVVHFLSHCGNLDWNAFGALYVAVRYGNLKAVEIFSLNSVASAELLRCLDVCLLACHVDILILLCQRSLSQVSSKNLPERCRLLSGICSILVSFCSAHGSGISSQHLYNSMLQSGFHACNAALQSGAAAVLESLIRMRSHQGQGAHVVGSWADGWGSCPIRLNGDIDKNSDIDVTIVLSTRPYHFYGQSACANAQCTYVKYRNGNINNFANVATPNVPYKGLALCPALELVKAFP